MRGTGACCATVNPRTLTRSLPQIRGGGPARSGVRIDPSIGCAHEVGGPAARLWVGRLPTAAPRAGCFPSTGRAAPPGTRARAARSPRARSPATAHRPGGRGRAGGRPLADRSPARTLTLSNVRSLERRSPRPGRAGIPGAFARPESQGRLPAPASGIRAADSVGTPRSAPRSGFAPRDAFHHCLERSSAGPAFRALVSGGAARLQARRPGRPLGRAPAVLPRVGDEHVRCCQQTP
jgi:hypothetical protein